MTTNTPDRSRTRFPGISSRAYEHPADRSALVALRSLSGFDVVLRKLSGLLNERGFRLNYLSGSVRAGEDQFRHVHDMVRDACYILDLEQVPEVYVTQDPQPNAMALGSDKPFIVINTGLIDLLDEEELRAVVGHEVGHILSGHALYRSMMLILVQLGARVAWLPLGNIAISGIVIGLQEWFRKAELSCDRAGLLVGQDPDASKRVLMKLAGGVKLAEMSTEAFLEQAREYDAAGDVRDGILKFLSLINRSHPEAVVRFAEIDRWAREGEYQAILAGNYPRRDDDAGANVGDEVRNAARSYKESWERTADPFIGAVRGAADTAASAAGGLFDRFGNRRGDGNNGSGGGN
ncbi:M48 family metallopeptidase [Actinomadura parmotrematis]|uniref:M48 family metallopeptidase n=1 Tax=Actinomadura parmotrematis TaxID=2864039 RepID=A0ABS7FV43_9ACTN|nr:M48 family metallopeptidase [Actinomadura parmotrematis]MBW8484060.1 M48 family metallopeptidase [Actinomadura parmotrematis]